MPLKRTFYRRVNKNIKPLHCECDKSYTRADHFERHKSVCGHNSEYVAASEPLPESSPDSRPFYCSCGVGFTAADAFSRHRNRMGHEGNWVQSRYQPRGHSATPSTAKPQDDRDELTGARETKPLCNIIETSSKATDIAAAPEGLEITSSEVISLVETSQTLQMQHLETGEIDSVSLEMKQKAQGIQISVKPTEDPLFETQSSRDGSEERSINVDEDQGKAAPFIDETAVPQQDQASTTESSTSPAQQTPKARKNDTLSLKSSDPLRKSKNAGICKDRSPKRNIERSGKSFMEKHCNLLSSVTVGLLAAGFCVWAGCNMFTAATSSREWVLDSTALQHIAKEGNSFHNKEALYEECSWARDGWSCGDWSGQVQLTFDNGKILTLEDVSYQPGARSNVVSLNKLGASGVSGFWNESEIAVYNDTSAEFVGKAVFGKSAYTLDGLVEEKTVSPSSIPATATNLSQTETTPSSTVSRSSQTTRATSLEPSARPWTSSLTALPMRSSTTTTVPTPKPTNTVVNVTRKPRKRPLRTSALGDETTTPGATATVQNLILNSTKASATGGRFSLYDLFKYLPEKPSNPKLPTSQPEPTPVQSTSSKKRRLEDATQGSSKKARTTSASPSPPSQIPSTTSSWSGWWPISVPRIPWPKGAAPSLNATVPSDQANAPPAAAEPSTEQASPSSGGAAWFGAFAKAKRLGAHQYAKERRAGAKAGTARQNAELKNRVRREGKVCPPCPPCEAGWDLPWVNRG
ncbi:hypothetical protein B5807_09078 [Epicoccum nigrum]|uniref:Retrovirus-related Pol polyprotein from transposon TNT 1-94-like beta-barrel domain-containing protein n=1 Tax=Epicoccum nigrum TaxID=105696 RepID=A0A1Y2LS44_EPING|nr:hypothetical protein B5807_09078 [Epicoccum nigrum]